MFNCHSSARQCTCKAMCLRRRESTNANTAPSKPLTLNERKKSPIADPIALPASASLKCIIVLRVGERCY